MKLVMKVPFTTKETLRTVVDWFQMYKQIRVGIVKNPTHRGRNSVTAIGVLLLIFCRNMCNAFNIEIGGLESGWPSRVFVPSDVMLRNTVQGRSTVKIYPKICI